LFLQINIQELELANFNKNFYDVDDLDFAKRFSEEYKVSLTKFYRKEQQSLKCFCWQFYNVEENDDRMQGTSLSSKNNELEPLQNPCTCPLHSSTTPCCNLMPKATSTNPFLPSPAKYSGKSNN
jgi:hypothetical protein